MLTARRTLKKGGAPKRRSRKRLQSGRIATLGEVVQRGGLTPGATIKSYTYLFAGLKKTGTAPTLGTLGARGSSSFGKSGGMVFDNDGIMYVATSCGILKIDKSGTATRYVTPLQLGTAGSTAETGSLYLALAWLGTTKSTLIAGSISPDAFPGDPVYPLVLIQLGTPPIVTRKTNLQYNVMTMCTDSQGNVYWTGDDCCTGVNYSVVGMRLSIVYKIDPTGTTVVPFLGNATVSAKSPAKGETLPVNSTNGISWSRGPMGGLSYNPLDNCIYLFSDGGGSLQKISLTDNTYTGLDSIGGNIQGANFLGAYASVVDPVLNVMYMYNANWDGSGLGYMFMYDLTTKKAMRFSGTGTGGNALTESGLFPAGESTIVVPTSTNAGSFSSTTKGYPSTCRHLAIDAGGYVYFGAYGGGNQSSAGIGESCIYMISPYGPPQAPSTFSVVTSKTTATSITITWSNDTNAAEYEFTITPNTPGIVMPKGRATTATFSQLADSTSYVVTLRAKNMMGVAPTITTFPAVSTNLNTDGFALLDPVPYSVNNLVGSTTAALGVTLSWSGLPKIPHVMYRITPTSPAGAAITGTIPQTNAATESGKATVSPYTVTGLTAGVSYKVTITCSLDSTFPAGSFSVTSAEKTFRIPNQCSTTLSANYTMFFAGTSYTKPYSPVPGTFGTRFNANVGMIGTMIFDSTGTMYCGTTYGIVKIDAAGTISSFVTPQTLNGTATTTSEYLFIAFGANNTIVALSWTGAPLKVIQLPAGTVTTPKTASEVKVCSITSDRDGNIYFGVEAATTYIYKIDKSTYATTQFAGSSGATITVTLSLWAHGAPLAYNRLDNTLYFHDGRAKSLIALSLTNSTARTVCLVPDFFFSMALDPVANVMYFGGQTAGENQGTIYSVDLSKVTSATTTYGQLFSGTKNTDVLKHSIQAGTSKAGYSIVCSGDTTGSSYMSTALYGYMWHLSVDPGGNLYVPGDWLVKDYSHIYVISPVPEPQDPSSSSQTAATKNSVTITWSNDTYGKSYTFTVTPSIPAAGIPVLITPATTATFTGMRSSTQYTIKIIAANKMGTAPATGAGATVVVTTGLDGTGFALEPPKPIAINLLGNTPSVVGVYLSWRELATVPHVRYTITPMASSDSSGPSTPLTPSGTAIIGTVPQTTGTSYTQFPHTVTGLEPGTTYSVTVTASLKNTFPNDAYSVTTEPMTFTTSNPLPVHLSTLIGGASNAQGTSLNSNRGTIVDQYGNMYIASTTCIYKVSPSVSRPHWLFDITQTFPTPTELPYNPTKVPIGVGGSTVTLFAGTTTAGSPSTTPQTDAAIRFGKITGISYSLGEDALYVVDSMYSVIVRVSLKSPLTATVVAGKTMSPGNIDGALGVNRLSDTIYSIISSYGSWAPPDKLYMTDYTNNTVRILDPLVQPQNMTTLQSAASTPITVTSPSSILLLPNGSFLVASSSTHNIQLLRMSSFNPFYYTLSPFAGISGTSGNADGPRASATFNAPTSLAMDAEGIIYVYDSGNSSIRAIIGDRVYTYLGGTAGNVDGPAASARLNGGQASTQDAGSELMLDSNGFLYISDTKNNALRVVAPYAANQVISDSQLKGYRASAAQASSALVQTTSSAVAQVASSALAQEISGARHSSAVAQVASSALAQEISGARQSSAVAQEASKAQASSALAQEISGAQQSSAVAQEASKAEASSALAQYISGSRESSAVAQVASSALAQSISGAQQSSAVAQEASKAQASSALAQEISGARHSSAVAQQDSSAQQQAASSAVAQADSSAQQQEASASVEQRASSAVAQTVSSALAQSISGAQQSSAVAQEASKAQASSALAQEISGARHSSAVAQQDSSAQQQAASSAVQQADSSAQQQAASSAKQQFSSSAIQQADSSAQKQAASSAVQQADSSAQEQEASASVQQRASSAEQQSASSAMQQTDLAAAVSIKDAVKDKLKELQADIAANAQAMYTEEGTTVSGSVMLSLQNKMLHLEEAKRELLASSREIFRLSPTYQDPSLQTIVQDNTLSAFGVKKVFDALRNNYIFLDSSNRIVANPLTPFLRAYTSGATQGGGGKRRKKTRKSAVLFYKV